MRKKKMEIEPDIYVPLLPEICPDCGQALLDLVQQQTEMYQIAHQ
jgi:hypothetical protein